VIVYPDLEHAVHTSKRDHGATIDWHCSAGESRSRTPGRQGHTATRGGLGDQRDITSRERKQNAEGRTAWGEELVVQVIGIDAVTNDNLIGPKRGPEFLKKVASHHRATLHRATVAQLSTDCRDCRATGLAREGLFEFGPFGQRLANGFEKP
jgi:hypothetical protein